MDQKIVQDGFNMLKGYAEQYGLGRPSKVLKSESFGELIGVGVEWPGGQRTAISTYGCHDEAQEVLRLAEAWKDEA